MTFAAAGRRLRRVSPDTVIALVLLITVLALWLPFGFNVGFRGDDWFFYLNAQGGAAWAALSRPLLPLAYVLGYALAPGHFAGFNLMLVILLVARSWLSYAILLRLGSGWMLAFALAILVAAVPADTGVFYMGALNVYFAWVAYLLALYLLIVYWKRPRLSILVLMWCALIVNLGTYEAAYPLIVVSPLALLLLPRRSRRQWIATLFRWYLFPALNAVRLLALALLSPDSLNYQSGLVQHTVSVGSMISSLFSIYERHFITGWLDGGFQAAYWPLALALGVLAAAVCGWLGRSDDSPSLRLTRWFALAGFLIVGLAMAALLPTVLSTQTTRVFFVSSVGAALALAAVLRLLARRALFFALLVGLFVALGCARLLEQHASYAANTQAQQAILLRLAARVPSIAPGSALLIMDETPERELYGGFGGRWGFQNPLLLIYGDPALAVGLCYPDDMPENPEGYCAFHDSLVEARISPLIVWSRPYDHVILLRYTAEHEFVLSPDLAPYGHSSVYQPGALINVDSPLPEVVQHMFVVQK